MPAGCATLPCHSLRQRSSHSSQTPRHQPISFARYICDRRGGCYLCRSWPHDRALRLIIQVPTQYSTIPWSANKPRPLTQAGGTKTCYSDARAWSSNRRSWYVTPCVNVTLVDAQREKDIPSNRPAAHQLNRRHRHNWKYELSWAETLNHCSASLKQPLPGQDPHLATHFFGMWIGLILRIAAYRRQRNARTRDRTCYWSMQTES